MGWLLLGVDSLIACIAVGPLVRRRLAVPFALLFGVGDGGGYLLGCARHWSFPDNLGFLAPTVVAVIGLYWIAVAIISRRAAAAEQNPRAHWGIWILPWLLSLDNITFGAVDGVSRGASIWASAGEQAASSIVQAGTGLAIGMGVAYSIPALRRRVWLPNATAAGAMLVAAGVLIIGRLRAGWWSPRWGPTRA